MKEGTKSGDFGSIGKRLRAARALLGMSQIEMAAAASIPSDTYTKYERNKLTPGGDALAAVARLGVNTNWLLTEEGPMLLSDDAARHVAQDSTHNAYAHAAEAVKSPAKVVSALAGEVGFNGPTDLLLLLVELMARGDITEAGARGVLQHVNGLLKGVKDEGS